MQTFEYLRQPMNPNSDALEGTLNGLGSIGWELVAAVPSQGAQPYPVWVFKRAVAPEPQEAAPQGARQRMDARNALAQSVGRLLARQEAGSGLRRITFDEYWENILTEGMRDEYVARAREVIFEVTAHVR